MNGTRPGQKLYWNSALARLARACWPSMSSRWPQTYSMPIDMFLIGTYHRAVVRYLAPT